MIVATLCLGGATAGIAGWMQAVGVDHRLYASIADPIGYTGLFAALMGGLTPIGVVVSSFFFAALLRGGRLPTNRRRCIARDHRRPRGAYHVGHGRHGNDGSARGASLMTFWVSVLEASVRLGVPLLLVALGELIAERSGVINIGLEGMMSAGAYIGFVVMAAINNAQLAIPAAMLAGVVVASVMAGVAIWGRVNQILTGFALFVMVPAATAFLYQQNASGLVVTPALPALSVPILSDIPFIGRVFFAQNEFYYIAVALCLLIWAFFNRTLFGLQVTACGHDPDVAILKGVPVLWIRTAATLACGAMAGLAGAALTVGALGQFSPGVTGGLGFIAIAVVILGRWRVQGVVIAAFAIGFADAFRLRLGSQLNFPVQLLAMLPWIVVLLMLIAGARFANVPRALGRTFGSRTALRST